MSDDNEKIVKEDGEGAVNTVSAIATNPAPLFMVSRHGKMKNYHVKTSHYEKLKEGKKRYTRWGKYVTDSMLKESLQKDLYKTSRVIVTDDVTGSSVFLKHIRQKRMFKIDESVDEDLRMDEIKASREFKLKVNDD